MPVLLHPDTAAALASGEITMGTVLEFDFSQPLRISSRLRDIEVDVDNFIGSGHLLSIGSIPESSELEVGSLRVRFSNVEQSILAIPLTQNVINRAVTIRRVLFDQQGQIIGDPISEFEGEVVGYEGDENGDTGWVEFECANHFADFEKLSGRTTNHNSMQLESPGDTFFETFGSSVTDVPWGRG